MSFFSRANALQNMKTGQGPEVSINTRAGGKSVEELTGNKHGFFKTTKNWLVSNYDFILLAL